MFRILVKRKPSFNIDSYVLSVEYSETLFMDNEKHTNYEWVYSLIWRMSVSPLLKTYKLRMGI